MMYTVGPKPESCAVTARLDRVATRDGPLYSASATGLLMNVASLVLLDRCVNCPFGAKREYTISNGMTELKCLKWGFAAEV